MTSAPRQLVPFVEGALWTCWRPLRFYGLSMGTRMTLCRLASGELWIHSPIAPDDALVESIRALGPVRWIVAPSRLHHLYVLDLARHFPEASIHGSPRLPEKRPDIPFASVLGDAPEPGWAGEIDQIAVRGHSYLDEVVFLHRPTRTLILADLCEEGNESWPFFSRLAARAAGIWKRHGPPRDMKILFRNDRKAARESIERILAWDFERMILSHGSLVERDAKRIFQRAYAFALAW